MLKHYKSLSRDFTSETNKSAQFAKNPKQKEVSSEEMLFFFRCFCVYFSAFIKYTK